MELSKEMMEGEKWNFFILKLSFFGWLLLCVFTFGIGGFFLEPYMQATYAEFYAAMRSKALAMGMTTTDELGGFVRHDILPQRHGLLIQNKPAKRRGNGSCSCFRGVFWQSPAHDFTLLQTIVAKLSQFITIIKDIMK